MRSFTTLLTTLGLFATSSLANLHDANHGKRHEHIAHEHAKRNLGLYTLEDKWHGPTFFNGWTFFNESDPTHGQVTFVTQQTAQAQGLAYITASGTAIMQVDQKHDLPYGAKRNSVRITTNKSYNSGLFILDAARFPYGCAVWPAWWMFGPDWPNNGEIDIFENVNLATTNQYTAHTLPNCLIDSAPSASQFPGFQVSSAQSKVGLSDCGPTPNNLGCDWVDTSTSTFGAGLNAGGGAVFAMEWMAQGVRIWNFPRAHIPLDITLGHPSPSLWPNTYLKAAWAGSKCPPGKFFGQMSMVFDITLCGDWAGNVYGLSGCSVGGSDCATRVMKGSNFANAVWEINYVAVYNQN